MLFKNLILIFFAFINFWIFPQHSEYIALRLSAIINNSHKNINLPAHDVELTDNVKKVVFSKKINIPFISISEYIKEYTTSAQGRAFIPKGALIIVVGERTFGIWENEKGVMYSPISQTEFDEETWPCTLFNSVNIHKPRTNSITSILKLLLLIDKKGHLKLENLKTFSIKN